MPCVNMSYLTNAKTRTITEIREKRNIWEIADGRYVFILLTYFQSLTCGTGFYSSKVHETVWKGRKLVLRDKETG